jgi:hypothetical protein
MERKSPLFTCFIYVCAILLAVVILAPIAWLFIMSISPAADLAAKPLRWWPQTADFSRYKVLLSTLENSEGAAFTSSLRNSIEVGRHGDDRRHRARHPGRLGRLAHAVCRLVALHGDRHLHAAAGGAGRAALYGACLSRPAQQCFRTGARLSDDPGAVYDLADEIRLRFYSEGDRGRPR